MAAPTSSSDTSASSAGFYDADVPPLPADATPAEKDAHWFKYVYRGDKMPQLTVRAVLMGGILGMLMSAANLYTTLAIGWSFGVAITACVMSFVIWNVVSMLSGKWFVRAVLGISFVLIGLFGVPAINRFLADHGVNANWQYAADTALGLTLFFTYLLIWNHRTQMSILENNCMQSTASAAGYSTGSTIATMFGAMLLLEQGDSTQIKTFVVQNWFLVGSFTFLTGMMGVFLAIPMKRQMINHEQLPFPSGIAAATTLKSLYSKSREAVLKAYSLVISLALGAVTGILNTDDDTAEKVSPIKSFFDWTAKHMGGKMQLPELIPAEGLAKCDAGKLTGMGWGKGANGGLSWGTSLESTPGHKLIDFGFQPSALLVAAGMIVGMRVSLTMLAGSILLYFFVAPWLIGLDAPHALADGKFPADYHPSIELVAGGTIYHVYRWALWGGTGLMVFSSLTALAFQWRTIGRAFSKKPAANESATTIAEMADIEVPGWWLFVGMVPITIAMVILQVVAFKIAWWAGLIAVFMSFVLSMVACRATGETDTTPIGAMGKVMQLMFALFHPGMIKPNLASAGIAANSASSSADLLTDLKSGYLLGANPKKQFIAQFVGVFFGTIAIVPIWYLMVPDKAHLEKFPAPGTQSWFRVAQILTNGISSLPDSSKIALVIGCVLGIILPTIERFVPAKFKPYWPSTMGLGLSWVVPFASSFAFALGAFISWLWGKFHAKSNEAYNVPIASGLVAGESLMKAVIAMAATILGLLSGK
jgi:uncharacterized oligopeptide transporter (OPT) family protein